MPLMDSNLEATWQSLYRFPHPTQGWGTVVGYDALVKDQILGGDHWLLLSALQSKGMAKGQKIVLVGAGYGWVAAEWAAQGWGPIIAIDTSTYIQARKAQNATVEVYNYDINTNKGRNDVKAALGVTGNNKVDWGITEDVLPMLSDAECSQLSTFAHNICTNVAHWTSVADPGNFAPLNWKTLAAWKALLPSDYVIRRGTAEIL